MKIVTLLSDIGNKDWLTAQFKGEILKNESEPLQFVDVSHLVPSFDIVKGAIILDKILTSYPEDTVHFFGIQSLINSYTMSGSRKQLLVARVANQWIIGADNGFLSLLKTPIESVYQVGNLPDSKSEWKSIYAPVISDILNGMSHFSYAPSSDYQKVMVPVPRTAENIIMGNVRYVDSMGNVHTNINRSLFEDIGQGAPFHIFLRRKEYNISKISEGYDETEMGEKMAMFSSDGYLKIVLNHGVSRNGGGASELLGLKPDDPIQIEFNPRGSATTFDTLF